jgi:hypothetical protein
MANPNFKGYTPAEYAPRSVNLGMFAPALGQMQERYDLASQTLDEVDFDFSSLAPDNERAAQIGKEFDEFKGTLADDLLKTKDFRNAARELRRLNKIYNEDPEINIYRQRKAQFLADSEVMRKKVEKNELSETDFKNWEKRVLGEYAEQGGAAYNRTSGSAKSFDSSPRNINLEKELMDKVEELAKAAPTWGEAVDKISDWNYIDPETRERLKTTVETLWKDKNTMTSEIFRHLSQSDYFKDSLKDNARDRYYVESRTADPENKGLMFGQGVIEGYVRNSQKELEAAKMELANASPENKAAAEAKVTKLTEALQDYTNRYNNIMNASSEEEIARGLDALGQATYEADYITGKLLGYSSTASDIFDYMKTDQSLVPYTDNVGGAGGGGGGITTEDVNNTNLNIVESPMETIGTTKVVGYTVGEVNSQFAEEAFGGKDFYEYVFDPKSVKEDWLSEVEDMNQVPGLEKMYEGYQDFWNKVNKKDITLSTSAETLIKTQEKNAKLYHNIDDYNTKYNTKLETNTKKVENLKAQLTSATGAEADRIKGEIIELNKNNLELKAAKEATFAGPNAYLGEFVSKLNEDDIDYDETLVEYVKNEDFDKAWKFLSYESKRRLLLTPTAISKDPREINVSMMDFGELVTNRGDAQILLNKANTPLMSDLSKRLVSIKTDVSASAIRGIAIDDSSEKWVGDHLKQLDQYIDQNIHNPNGGPVVVTKIEGNKAETLRPGEQNYPMYNMAYYGEPTLYKTISEEDGSAMTLLKYSNKSFADIKKATKEYYKIKDSEWNEMTAELKEQKMSAWKLNNPQTLFLGVDNTTHYVNAMGNARNTYGNYVTKATNAILIGEQTGFPNPEAEIVLGNSIHNFAALNLTDGKIQDEYKEAEAALLKMDKEGDKNKSAKMILQHQPALYHRNTDGTMTGFRTTYRYVPEVGGIQAQVERLTLNAEGQLIGEPEPYQAITLNASQGGYAQSIMALDLTWGTGNYNFLPSYGNAKVVPAFNSIEVAKRISSNF